MEQLKKSRNKGFSCQHPHLLRDLQLPHLRGSGPPCRGPVAGSVGFADKETELFPVAGVSHSEILALVKNNLGHNLFEVASGVNKTAVGD